MRDRLQWMRTVALAVCGFLALSAAGAPSAEECGLEPGGRTEVPANVGHRQQAATLLNRPGRSDQQLANGFATDYRSAVRMQKRAVFRRYLPTLGADGILDVLETRNRFCHSEAHDLGKEIFSALREIGPALEACGNRCTSGCLHGVMMEAFLEDRGAGAPSRHVSLREVKPRAQAICRDGVSAGGSEPGNCAHGVGHAILILSGYDLGEALNQCGSAFEGKALGHYCASGAFMEYQTARAAVERNARSRHYPCDTYTQFPAACYKYKSQQIFGQYGGDPARVAAECGGLEQPSRRGCFYGLGTALLRVLRQQPDRLGEVCGFGDAQDQAMCVNGAIEILSDYHWESAQAACQSLNGEVAAACWAAARNKRYGLDKSFDLYTRD